VVLSILYYCLLFLINILHNQRILNSGKFDFFNGFMSEIYVYSILLFDFYVNIILEVLEIEIEIFHQYWRDYLLLYYKLHLHNQRTFNSKKQHYANGFNEVNLLYS
jgi:hypothetical protein